MINYQNQKKCSSKHNVKEINGPITDWKKIFTQYISDKVLVTGIQKEYLLYNINNCNSLENISEDIRKYRYFRKYQKQTHGQRNEKCRSDKNKFANVNYRIQITSIWVFTGFLQLFVYFSNIFVNVPNQMLRKRRLK